MSGDPDADRPHPTRHDTGSDSISVSELLERHQRNSRSAAAPAEDRLGDTQPNGPTPIAEPQSPVDSGQLFITELLRREGRLDEPPPPAPRPARSYRPMIAAVALVLVGGVATAGIAALAASRDDRPPPAVSGSVTQLSGPDALLPDAILATIDQSGTASADAAAAGKNSAPEPAGPGETLDPAAVTDPVTGVVTAFFQTAATAPTDAYQLLDADLRGNGMEDFARSWDGVERVRIDSITRDGSLVRAVLRVERDDGSTLHLVHEVRVRTDRIVEATLLSAVVSR